MASFPKSCDVCDLRQISKLSIIWCTECDEGLCKECQEHHSLSRGTRNHQTIGITEYQNLPSDVLTITQYCIKHQEQFIIYCRKHKCPCCRKCIVESHKECRDIDNLDDVIKNIKTSNAVQEIEKKMVEMAENLQKIFQHQQENLSTLKIKRTQIEKEIIKTRTTINTHLDNLQEDLIKQLYAVEEKENSKIHQLLSTLEKKEIEIAKYQRNTAYIKQHATDLQLFLSIKKIGEDVSSKDEFLNSLFQGQNLKNHSLEYRVNTAIQSIISDIKSFGDVRIADKPCEIVITKKKTKQAQTMVPTVQSRFITNIKLKKHKTINTLGGYIYGSCMLPDDRMAFTYITESSVRVFNNKAFKDFEVKIPCEPFDIVYNNEDNTLAVTSGGSVKQRIIIIDLHRKQIKKTITLDSLSFGIVLIKNKLIFSAYDKGIRMINLYDESISDIVQDNMPSCCYIAIFGNQIYHTNSETNSVTCYDQNGESQWTFQNEIVLVDPRGIDVDSDGNVYVVGHSSHNVVVISPDGQQHREVLTAVDGLNRPLSICYNKTKKQLLVANFHNVAQLFNFV